MSALSARFWQKVDKTASGGCWIWMGNVNSRGYGLVSVGDRKNRAHRAAYQLLVGEIPAGLCLDHQCHNKRCVNPAHMRLCTPVENVRNALTSKSNTSGFKGVSWEPRTKLWQAKICLNRKQIHLGRFTTPEAAHEAYKAAALRLHGEFACFGDVPVAP